jgi:cytochrome c
MKKKVFGIAVAMVVIFGMVYIANAVTLDDAKGLAEKAAAFWKANGKEKAIAEFNNPKGQFVKGDLYIVAHDFKGIVLARGTNQSLVGVNLFDQKDPNGGRFFVREEIDIAMKKGSGWINYSWTNPATKKVQDKKSWVQKIDGADAFVLCGIFQ